MISNNFRLKSFFVVETYLHGNIRKFYIKYIFKDWKYKDLPTLKGIIDEQ